MSWWLLVGVVVYAFAICGIGEFASWTGRFIYLLFIGVPGTTFFFYCLIRGFRELGVIG